MGISQRDQFMAERIKQRSSSTDLADMLGPLIHTLSSAASLPEVSRQILVAVLDMTPAGTAALWANDPRDGRLVLIDVQGLSDKDTLLKSLEGWMADDPEDDGAILDYQENVLRSNRKEEVFFVPLRVSGQMAGILGAVHDQAGQGFDLQDLQTFSTIGDLATIAIQLAYPPDVIEPILAEHQREIEQLKQRENARTEYIDGLVHDLKAPISSIKGYIGLIQNTNRLNEQGQAFLQAVLDTTDRILNMVHQLLDIALASNNGQIKKRPLDLGIVVEETLKDMKGAASSKQIGLRTQIAGKPYPINGDERRLARCLLNLLDNAIKYSPENSDVFVALTYSKDGVTLRVRDEGPGIDSEDLPHIFDQFYQGKGHDKSGVGLGLQLVQATAAAHGGTVTVRNLEDAGAEFTIMLPARPVN